MPSKKSVVADKDTRKGKKSRKRERKAAQDMEEEEQLAALLFGGATGASVANAGAASTVKHTSVSDQAETSDVLFEIDRSGEDRAADEEDDSEHEDMQDAAPAWKDEDNTIKVDLMSTSRLRKLRKTRDEQVSALESSEFEERLRQRFKDSAELTARTDWANMQEKYEHEEEDEEDVSGGGLLSRASEKRLPPNLINIVRCPDANLAEPNNSVVQTVNFHPASDPSRPLLLTGGLDKTLRFFQVGEEKSEKIHGIHFPKLPIYSAAFVGSSGNVVVSGRRSFFYVYDSVEGKLDLIPSINGREERSLEKFVASPDSSTVAFLGNDGYIVLYNIKAKEWIANLKINGSVRSITFTPDGEQILASGSDGDVYRWDLRTRKCIECFANEDGTISSSMCAADRYLAVGAESGVVNLYSDYGTTTRTVKNTRSPSKSIMNIKTSIDCMRFNPDGQVLGMSSRREKQSLRLVHVPTGTVFANWPTSKTPLGYVWSFDFSPDSRYMAIGNDKGRCLLYKLSHYHS